MPFMNPNNDPEFKRLMRRLQNARTKTKVHHETCPVCGAKLVNLYRKSPESGEWRCRKCWEKYDVEAAKATENDTPRCKTCQIYAEAMKNQPHCICAWYLANVINGNQSTKSCPNYKPVKGE